MKTNWKVRFKNKTWLASFISCCVSFVYTIFNLFDIYPEISQNSIMQISNMALMMLSLMGVIMDPTTEGFSDSDRAMSYEVPYSDTHPPAQFTPDEEDEEYVDPSESKSNEETGT